ncbi:cytochrome P450 [Actinophytocola sp.]|uniref:cytochrome P450 n=1 Tax=Actinophytocola sp. TaxID=1872138 RepID=UPI002D7EEC3B|nr:cytochrome P450 [Actinophytocola sp.]HET9139527.1 cytochrome P450 [Actinophytocola sp.]
MTLSTRSDPVSYPFKDNLGIELDERYRAVRETPGMIRVQMPFGEPAWLATRYSDARLVLGDRRFSRAMSVDRDAPRLTPNRLTQNILAMDPPEHTRLRTLVAKAFTMHRMEALRPRVREIAEAALAEMVAGGQPADLVEQFALTIPVAVICELLGVPLTDRPKFRAWSDAAMSTARMTLEQFEANQSGLRGYIADLIAARRAQPADDLITALVEARDERDRLSEDELIDILVTLLVAGHETTATQIPNFVYVLLERPARWAELLADPELIPAAVEELLRFVPLGEGPGFPRYATEDIEVGGTLVREGEPVVIAVGAANRDELRFPGADEVRFDRENNQHIGFGHGVHHCLGATLARVELQEALRVLLARVPNLRLAGDLVWKTEMLVRGPRTMPVGW